MSDQSAPLVIVLTGPSGVGKDSVFDRMIERGVPVARPATMTTRAPRPGEEEGVHHYFVTREEFRQNVAARQLLEHAEVYGNSYGVPRKSVRTALDTGRDVVIRVDIQGAKTLHGLLPGAFFICLTADGIDDLRARLLRRSTESAEDIEGRISIAKAEIEEAREFCTMVVNREGRLDDTVDEILRLMDTERVRPGRRTITL
ncbi:MAG: guanylate kinase [Dehalococcoidia bacterium]|nr:MAG: guanylate kinase [Dehalococcoidia bacterium]